MLVGRRKQAADVIHVPITWELLENALEERSCLRILFALKKNPRKAHPAGGRGLVTLRCLAEGVLGFVHPALLEQPEAALPVGGSV